MPIFKTKLIYIFFPILILLFVGNAFCEEQSSSLLPVGLIMEDIFKPGYGLPLGRVVLVQGKVVIMHAEMSSN